MTGSTGLAGAEGCLEFRILGPLEFRREGSPVPLTAPKQRGLLAVLLIRAGRPLPAERLVDELWGAEPPRSADGTLHSLLSRLRGKGLTGLVREPGGYRLEPAGATLDARVFERHAVRARELAGEGRLERAAGLFREALGLWRAEALADVPDSPIVTAERARLDGLRPAVVEEYADVLAGLGRHAQAAGELRGMLAEHPLRESLWERLILALDRSGQPREALAAYEEARRVLAEELRLDPGPELRLLQETILRRRSRAAAGGSGDGGSRDGGDGEAGVEAGGAPQGLPPDLAYFTGHRAALRELTAFAEGGNETAPAEGEDPLPALGSRSPADHGRPPADHGRSSADLGRSPADLGRSSAGRETVVVVSGMPGVGKSALAVHWAHRMAGRFPGGRLFIDLRGHRPREAVTPREALDRFVRALGMPPERVPAGEDELAAAYRSLLADRRVLVVLDNARDPAQVEPLLPGTGGSLALVTSRGRLSGLALRHAVTTVELDVLTEPQAVALLAAVVGPRAADEPEAVAELARQCGRLPLALRIAGAHLAGHPHRPIRTYLADLAERGRLAALRLGDAPAAAVMAAFDLSHEALAEPDRVAFRRLGLVPGGDFTAPAAAAMLGVSAAEARARLDALRAASLLQCRRGRLSEERYRFHDLLRDYARHRAETEDAPHTRQEALRRLLEWYVTLRDPLALDDEHENVLAATRHAAEQGLDAAWRLPAALAEPLRLRHRLIDAAELHALAATAAGRAGRSREEAAARGDLGTVFEHLGRYPEALAEHRGALEIHRRLGDAHGAGVALRSIGAVSWLLGRYDAALAELDEAWRLLERSGDDDAVGRTLNLTGIVLRHLGRLEEAVTCYERALAVHRGTGDVHGQANTLNNLGVVRNAQGRPAQALELFREALHLRRAAGSRKGEARALNNIGLAEVALGRHAAALGHLRQALALHRATGDRRGEGQVANDLAGLYHRLGREEEALAHYAEALRIRDGIGDRKGLAETHQELAEAHAARGDAEAARHHLVTAERLFDELGVTG
ncbi:MULTISPECIES: tetratricopeptide repeat protein [unclassified Nonomuraea]|uniref:AfsR/SARP family transcriptional regulator n=1 Tax=unclassified Nonomuraea TaxID=2593643 RepID=UPI0033DE752E